jgi:hypothetical protein
MKNLLVVLVAMAGMSISARATTVQYSLSATATPDEYVVLFTTDQVLAQNQAMVVRFPYSLIPPSFVNLESPIGGVGYNFFVHQPNNPLGSDGDITLIRSASGSAIMPNFSIEATYFGGPFPFTLPYTIYQFDGSGSSAVVVSTLASGNAINASVPEPGSATLSLGGMLALGVGAWYRRKCLVRASSR